MSLAGEGGVIYVCVVNHRILIQKLYNITQDSQLCRVFQNMLPNRRFYVELNNDQPLHVGTRSFIYADDLNIVSNIKQRVLPKTRVKFNKKKHKKSH